MPVKVRCANCNKVLNAPDAARGKAVKCPGCGEKVRVPAEKTTAAAGGQKAVDDEDVFANLDLSRAEDRSSLVCVKCGTEVTEETVECPNCGVHPRTGQMSERVARKKARRGPDPDLYYSETVKDSWEFAVTNWTLALRSMMYWAVFLITGIGCCAFAGYVHARWGKPPVVVFFSGFGLLLLLGVPGWLWYLWTTVIDRTLSKQMKLERVHFDIFTVIALGIKYVMWSLVNSLWWTPITIPLALVLGQETAPVIGFVVGLVGILIWPIVMAHMAMPIQWKGWVSPLMWKILFKNFVPVLYWWGLAIGAFVVNIAVGAVLGFLLNQFAASIVSALGISIQQNLIPGTPSEISKTLAGVMLGVLVVLFLAQLFVGAFTYIFLMRANGRLVHFFKKNLELITEKKEVKFVRRLDDEGKPIKQKGDIGTAAAGIGGTLAFYIVLNVVVYFSTGGKYLILPRPLAKAVNSYIGNENAGGKGVNLEGPPADAPADANAEP